ncbi:hypothetical protein K438DRAFT_1937355 [Mycena galopus ATCC 62051]|nr:hypothetical protein K438DRAFT_1937355 [Mycena galopus ATCC 62051]
MPHRPTTAEFRVDSIVAGLTPTISLLKELTSAFDTPFVPAISTTIVSLLGGIQTVKKNKEDCFRLLEDIHVILYAIVDLHIKSETPGSLPPTMLHYVGKFTETLHKIHTFVEAQQEGLKMKTLFRNSEMNSLFKECQQGLQDALTFFKVQSGADILGNVTEMQTKADTMHEELLELIAGLSDGTNSDRMSSIYRNLNDSEFSSKSFAMLPSHPKILHGRDSELDQILQMFQQESPQIAILGPGGIGKTSLARAALHHPDVASKYEHRLFVSCEAATTAIDVAASIAAFLDLNPARDLTQPVIRSLSAKSASLLILDNLESAWEPLASRGGIEELLSLLTDIPGLALMVTMRGAELPAKVRWTRPFLQPLKPLSDDAARQTFIDIADDGYQEMDELLKFTGNMPLAVDLMAHLVVYDGATSVLARWETERTSVLSEGFDRRSNLDASITMSLLSPRLSSSPGAMDLLRLLSILPDGLSNTELFQSNLPIQDILACRAVLLGTSLAYTDEHKRLKSLVPIREHVQLFHSVQPSLVRPLQHYFGILLDLYQNYFGTLQTADTVKQITLNLGNLHQILLQGLKPENPDLADTVTCALSLNMFSRKTGRGRHVLMDHMKPVLHLCGPRLEIMFATELFRSQGLLAIDDPELLVTQVESQFIDFIDPVLEAQFYCILGCYYANTNNPKADQAMERTVKLVDSAEQIAAHAEILSTVAVFYWRFGEYLAGKAFARRAQKVARMTSNLYEEAHAMRVEGGCNIFLGDYKSSVLILRRARDLLELCGASESILYYRIRDLEADIHVRKSEYESARAIQISIAEKLTAENNPIDHAYSLLTIGEIDVAIGARNACENLEKAKSLFATLNFHMGALTCETVIVEDALRNQVVTTELKATMEKCLSRSWTDDPQLTFFALERMGDSSRWPSTDFEWASTYTVVYLAFSIKKKEKLALHKALRALGDVFIGNHDEGTAESLFIAALEGFIDMDVHRSRADCMIRLGDLTKNRGDSAGAKEFWSTARPLFERSLQTQGVAKIDSRLAALEQETA